MTNLRLAIGGFALAALAATGTANAQAPADQTAPLPACPPGSDQPTGQACPQPAQPAPPPAAPATTYEPPPAPPPPMVVEHEEHWYDTIGWGLSVGGGVEDFANSTMRNTTGTGGSWNARLTMGTKSYVALEGLYIGSAQSINRLGLSSNSTLYGNGAQADVRINVLDDYVVQPFIYGGGAWRYYSISNSSTNTSDVANNANVFELPAGVGIAGYAGGFMLDVRGEYRWAWGDSLVPNANGTGNGLNRWGVSGNIGATF